MVSYSIRADNSPITTAKENNAVVVVLGALFALAMVLNIILIGVIVWQHRKGMIYGKYDLGAPFIGLLELKWGREKGISDETNSLFDRNYDLFSDFRFKRKFCREKVRVFLRHKTEENNED